MKKLYFVLAILLTFSTPASIMAEEALPPVEYGTNPYTYDYKRLNQQQPTPYQNPNNTFDNRYNPYQQQPQMPVQTQPLPPQQPLVEKQPLQDTVPQSAVQQLPTEPNKNTMAAPEPDIKTLLKAKHKFALLVPLTGRGADIGKALRDAAKLALIEKGTPDYALIPIDINADGPAAAAEQAVADGAEVILGPVFSDDVGKVAKVARKNKIKVFTFSNNKLVAGNGTYVFGLIPSQQVERVLLYSANHGVKNYSAVVPNNLYGQQSSEMVTRFAKWIGGKSMEVGLYSVKTPTSTAAGVISAAYKAKGMKPKLSTDAVVIVEGGDKLKSVVNSLANAGVGCGRVRCLGVASWDDKKIISSPALSGAWYASSPYEDVEDFLQRFQLKYRYTPDEIASLGYDAASLAVELSPGFTKASIENPGGFKGLKGIYRFTGEGINQRGYAIYEIRSGLAQVLDSAPNRF